MRAQFHCAITPAAAGALRENPRTRITAAAARRPTTTRPRERRAPPFPRAHPLPGPHPPNERVAKIEGAQPCAGAGRSSPADQGDAPPLKRTNEARPNERPFPLGTGRRNAPHSRPGSHPRARLQHHPRWAGKRHPHGRGHRSADENSLPRVRRRIRINGLAADTLAVQPERLCGRSVAQPLRVLFLYGAETVTDPAKTGKLLFRVEHRICRNQPWIVRRAAIRGEHAVIVAGPLHLLVRGIHLHDLSTRVAEHDDRLFARPHPAFVRFTGIIGAGRTSLKTICDERTGRSTSRRPPAGGSGRTHAQPRRWSRAALRPPSAPTTPSSTQGRATRTRSACCWTPERPRRSRRRLRRRGGSSRRCACCPPETNARSTCAWPWRLARARVGELERCRAALLEAHELFPTDAVTRRVELTARCAAVEHWLGRHEEAHRRLSRAWEELRRPRDGRGRGARRSSSRLTASTSSTSSRRSRWASGRSRRRARLGDRPLIAAAAAALALAETTAGPESPTRAEHRRRRVDAVDALVRRASSRRAWRRSTTSPGPRPTSSTTTTRSRMPSAASRSRGPSARGGCSCRCRSSRTSRSRCRAVWREAIELCESALEAARLRRTRTTSSGRSSSSAGRATTPATSTARSPRTRRARASTRGWREARSRTAAAGPGWALGVALVRGGRGRARPRRCCASSVARASRARCPSSAVSTGRASRSPSWPLGDLDAADGYARRAEQDAAQLALQLPAALAGRARAAVLLAAASRSARPRGAHESAEAAGAVGAPLQAAFSRALAGARLPPPATARGDRDAPRGRARARRLRLASACATRCAASCGGSVRAPSRAARPRRETAASTR